jgi:hypothetical protein
VEGIRKIEKQLDLISIFGLIPMPRLLGRGTTKHENITVVGAGFKPAPTEPQQRPRVVKKLFSN